MKKESAVDYLEAVAQFSRELRALEDEQVSLPEPAGEQVVDYLSVSEQWKEVKGGMLRPMRVFGQEEE